jgi:glycosyltransferase involved in cell wall biosynthesis
MSEAFVPSFTAAGLPHRRLRIIPQGVDLARFAPLPADARAAVRASLGLTPAAPLVVFVGSLIERKGIDLLLSAWARVHEARPDARLLLVGKDRFEAGSPDGRFLHDQISRLPASAAASIRRLGLRDDPERWLGAADVFAFPSRREGFGTVMIEAMACGLPCVVARLDGITDLVFDRPIDGTAAHPAELADGIVVPQDDVPALSSALIDLVNHPGKRTAIGAAASARARQAFDMDRVIAPAYEQLYRSLVEQAGRG